jgi:hypothetical protein
VQDDGADLIKVDERYRDKTASEFIDPRYHQDQTLRFKIWIIPTLVFFSTAKAGRTTGTRAFLFPAPCLSQMQQLCKIKSPEALA